MRVLIVAATLALLGCRHLGAEPPETEQCDERQPSPVFEPPEPIGDVLSTVSVELSAETDWIVRRLESEVPQRLAQGEQRVGFAGKVRYVVRRGPMKVDLVDDRFAVTTPVTAEISVCKPIGSLCFAYASCTPGLAVTATVPLLLDSAYAMGESRVTSRLTQGCRLAGFNVSAEVQRRAAEEIQTVKRRIDAARPDLGSWVRRGYQELPRQLPLGPFGCLRVQPQRITQSPPKLEKGVLRTAITVTGKLGLASSCKADAHKTDPLPSLSIDKEPSRTLLELGLDLPWSSLDPIVTRAAAGASDGLSVRSAKIKGARIEGKSSVVAELDVAGACGKVWMVAEPGYDAESNAVRLTKVRPLPKFGGGLSEEQLAVLARRMAASTRVTLSFDPRQAKSAIDALVAQALSPVQELSVSVDLEPTPGRVLVGSGGLVAVIGLQGQIRIQPKTAPS